ncbi:hypothetical protein [Portibacter lacus]|uniref:hypothetical protein n=1 Tax=Portibacter lacus TaxID=1099794 RepID=UPI001F1F0B40|nr:hypothetical protein [Portibacter lacus]
MKKNCKMCKQEFNGRSDKLFCGIACKNEYHHKLRKVNSDATSRIDSILHRNRSILLEIMGKNKTRLTTSKMVLDRKKFNYTYMTGYSINNQGKTYHHIYDFSYMLFSSPKVLIVRKK